jgi:hypothetical protein
MSCSKEAVEFYRGFPVAAEKRIRDVGPRFLCADDLTKLVPVRDLVALALANGVIKPDIQGRLATF